MRDGAVDVFFGLGGNFVAATPDTEVDRGGHGDCALTVHVSTKLNRSHLHHGREALILPCLGRTERDQQAAGEQFVTVEDSMSMVHASTGPAGAGVAALRSEVAIVTGLGQALFGADDPVGWLEMGERLSTDPQAHRARRPRLRRFEERVAAARRVRAAEPAARLAHLRHRHRQGQLHGQRRSTPLEVPPGTCCCRPCARTTSSTPRSTASTTATAASRAAAASSSSTPTTWPRLGLANGELVDLVSVAPTASGAANGFRAVEYDTPRGCAAAYFPEANVLVPLDSTADGSNTPTSKSIVIRLEPAKP